MITSLRSPSTSSEHIDLAIGLTEGWVAGLLPPNIPKSPADRGYNIVGQWVQNPLRWSIVTGAKRPNFNSVSNLGKKIQSGKNLKVGVSRMGSGSHVMASVLAQREGWNHKDVEFVKCGPFKDLRDAVNVPDEEQQSQQDGIAGAKAGADFFMWEHFTTKPYFHPTSSSPSVPLKHLGEIYTPWPSWLVVASTQSFPSPSEDPTLSEIFRTLDAGIREFDEDKASGANGTVKLLGTGELGCTYGEEDAREWLKKVEFVDGGTRGLSAEMVGKVIDVLKEAGVVEVADNEGAVESIVCISR